MIELAFILATLFFFMASALTSRPLYNLSQKHYSNRVTAHYGFKVSELHYSYDQMIYFISMPTTLPYIKNALKEDLVIEQDYSSYFFPVLKGIKISLKQNGENMYLAYLPIGNFRLPHLDKLQQEGTIDEQTYLRISTSKLLDPGTLQEVREEVYKQLQVGRY
ncbi:hypothetical protein [Mesobacillus selenatarsenatis]|uniref:Uncharacterized protein n=1 Tax=Mesobacillus selenatarsenatis (strain DSM 18680 / JCM 14380 / FERM P-15431 / SF-1) TaxID=1321606 RepID=A0A0A8X0V3_MESS1|nr:hypothetical protein [Mesobacillus selenatarsenatis]GAM13548.1 hypothetical protein SAMD00020551_1693 [Mesobacillus selenatarsenatis SF-1]